MSNFWNHLSYPILALAPLSGISDSAMRRISKTFGADLLFTEFISVAGIYYKNPNSNRLFYYHPDEHPLVVQYFGNAPEMFAKAARVAETLGFDGVDINFGCPAKKVMKSGNGCSLMESPAKAAEIVQQTLQSTCLPVSIKVRTSYKGNELLPFLQTIYDDRIATINIHGRTYEQGFSGEINFELISEVKRIFPSKVLANGGITNVQQAQEVLDRTGADGIMIGRGAFGNPFIFSELRSEFKKESNLTNSADRLTREQDTVSTLRTQLMWSIEEKGEKIGVNEMKKHFAWYLKGFSHAKQYRKRLLECGSLNDTFSILDELEAAPFLFQEHEVY